MPSYDCPKCRTVVTFRDDLPLALKAEAAQVVRQSSPILAMRLLVDRAGTPLKDAKGIGLHITRRAGECHRCGTPLPGGAAVHCTKCRAVNLDW